MLSTGPVICDSNYRLCDRVQRAPYRQSVPPAATLDVVTHSGVLRASAVSRIHSLATLQRGPVHSFAKATSRTHGSSTPRHSHGTFHACLNGQNPKCPVNVFLRLVVLTPLTVLCHDYLLRDGTFSLFSFFFQAGHTEMERRHADEVVRSKEQ